MPGCNSHNNWLNGAKMIQIRRCDSKDFGQLIGLFRQLWPNKPINPNVLQTIFEKAISSSSRLYFCAVCDESVIGLASLSTKDNLWQEGVIGYIEEFVVDEKHRGQGIGTRLFEHLIAEAREKGCRRIELDSAFHRKEAHGFYERFGFESRAFLFSKEL